MTRQDRGKSSNLSVDAAGITTPRTTTVLLRDLDICQCANCHKRRSPKPKPTEPNRSEA